MKKRCPTCHSAHCQDRAKHDAPNDWDRRVAELARLAAKLIALKADLQKLTK